MQKGDIITINATIERVAGKAIIVKVKSGGTYFISEEDINTIRPKIEIPEGDKRKGK